MNRNYLFIFYLIVSILSSLCEALGLDAERIVNGLDANQQYFKYQVAVLGKYNYSNRYYLVCGGGIIGNKMILSAAHCFIDELAMVKNLSYSVAAGTDDLTLRKGFKVDVDAIYFPAFDDYVLHNDIAVLTLKKAWKLDESAFLMKLSLPTANESISTKIATVAGFGFNSVETRVSRFSGIRKRTGGMTDYHLRFEHIYIVDDNSCKEIQPFMNVTMSMCGLMVPLRPIAHAGTCSGDSGSPLVYNNKVYGIVSRNSIDCNETIRGGIYTRVSLYLDFIKNIMAGNRMKDTVMIKNPPHVPFKTTFHLLSKILQANYY